MDKPNRKANRLKNFDYSSYGSYFITICTKDKKSLFCHYVGDGILNQPNPEFTNFELSVDKVIRSMTETPEKKYVIEKYVIMPNHVHFLISITTDVLASSTPSNAIIPSFVSTFKRFTNKECNMDLWQRSYHDHIIRNDHDFQMIWKYIDENPIRWQADCFYISD